MLSVGRELNISNKRVVCRTCSWEGIGAELSAALVQVTSAPLYVYVYRCPTCDSFELARKGKLLQFRARASARGDEDEASAQSAQAERTMP